MGEPALPAQPVVAEGRKLVDAVLGEELRPGNEVGGFLRGGLGSVLAELRDAAILRFRIGPGAAHTVEPVRLVDPTQGLPGA